MRLGLWFRPPRRTLAVFLGLMLVLGGALGWLGWQWMTQDRALERQRAQERLESAADQAVATFQQSLLELDGFRDVIPSPEANGPPDGVVILQATKRGVDVYPPQGLLYFPVIPECPEPPDPTFAPGESLEYQRNDPARAADAFRALSRSPDAGVRAGALLRLGRTLRKAGRNDEALQIYSELAQLGRICVLGLPAELLAREARGTLLESIGRREDLRREAALLQESLWGGRWMLLRPAWEFHRDEAVRWLGDRPLTTHELDASALSAAAEAIYRQWTAAADTKGRQIQRSEGRQVLLSWMGVSDKLSAVMAGPAYLEARWAEALQGRGIQAALVDADGQVMIGAFKRSGPQAVRTAAATRLPGTLVATGGDSGAAEAGVTGRRQLLLIGFSVLALVLFAGSYFIMRSITRERAVAKLQSEFVSAVSHEFRTPLTSLRQLSEMLAKGRVPTEDLKQKSYDIMSGESERLQRLVESLLDFGRLEARAFRYRLESLDPTSLVRDLIAQFREKAPARGFRIEMNAEGGYPPILADREALSLALWNLLDNAVKYSPECRTVWVALTREKDRLAVSVRDQGMGIAASEQKEIFKRFVRGTASRAAHIQGTGIGLALARHIVEAHHGEIRLESKPGIGSTFTILLPWEKTA
jgi:signal transduction histidine kinase